MVLADQPPLYSTNPPFRPRCVADPGDRPMLAAMKHLNSFDEAAALPAHSEKTELCALVQRAREGDFEAVSELVRRYEKRVKGFIATRLRPGHPAIEDVAQMTLIKLVRCIGQLRDPSSFESWLFLLARNACLDHWRQSQRAPVPVEFPVGPEEPFELPQTLRFQQNEAIELALAQLKPSDQKLLRQVTTGASLIELSTQLGLSVQNTKTRLHRARARLREVHRSLDAA